MNPSKPNQVYGHSGETAGVGGAGEPGDGRLHLPMERKGKGRPLSALTET